MLSPDRPLPSAQSADQQSAPAIELVGIEQTFGNTRVLNGINLALEPGRVLALLGPSGCGKTTLLKIIAGLLAPIAGMLRIFGTTVACADKAIFVPPERRSLGMVFQDYALWPHLTVGGNVAFPLEMRSLPRPERQAKVAAALARVALNGYENRSPASLSGGQQQRVAIARAIIAEPRLVLVRRTPFQPRSGAARIADRRDRGARAWARTDRGLCHP